MGMLQKAIFNKRTQLTFALKDFYRRFFKKRKLLILTDMNTSSQPLVSVLMTVYNREKYIADAIRNVIKSTYQHWELIIVRRQI